MVEEVVTPGESVAVPFKGVEGSSFALPDLGLSRCVTVDLVSAGSRLWLVG